MLLRQVGINPIVVHGGGPQIGRMLDRLKIKSEFVDGLRVTDQETVDVVEMVLAGSINKEIVSAINHAGGFAVGLSGKDGNLMRAQRLRRTKRDPGSNIERVIDLGLVGEPTEINPHILRFYERSDITPVIAPIGVSVSGETLNINADTAAGAIAASVGAKRLLMLTDIEGVLDRQGKLVPEMTAAEARRYIARWNHPRRDDPEDRDLPRRRGRRRGGRRHHRRPGAARTVAGTVHRVWGGHPGEGIADLRRPTRPFPAFHSVGFDPERNATAQS